MERLTSARYLSFCSAGTQGYMHVGALDAIEDLLGDAHDAWFEGVEGIVGCSSGCLAMLMFALGMCAEERRAILRTLRMDRVFDTSDLAGVPEHFGAFTLVELRRVLCRILEQYGMSATVTFERFYRFTRRNCVVVTSNVTRMEEELMSHRTHPRVAVVDAVCASCAIPFVFRPVRIGDCLYSDGNVCQGIPDIFDPRATLFFVIGNSEEQTGEMSWPRFSVNLFSMITRTQSKVRALRASGCVLVDMCDESPPFDPFLADEDVARMRRAGYLAALAAFADPRRALGACVHADVRCRTVVDVTTTDDEAPPRTAAP